MASSSRMAAYAQVRSAAVLRLRVQARGAAWAVREWTDRCLVVTGAEGRVADWDFGCLEPAPFR